MTTKLLQEEIIRQVKEVFDQQLQNPVEILFFGSKIDCEHCDDTRQLLEEILISDKLRLRIYDLADDADVAKIFNVTKAPGLVVTAWEDNANIDYGIRFAGIPSGYEFSSLIQSLVLVSRRDSGLALETRAALAELKEPVLLQVFVTPT